MAQGTSLVPPPWYGRVGITPLLRRRAVAVDTSAIIDYLESAAPDPELRFVFESEPTLLTLSIGRQAINEAVWPAIPRPGPRWQSLDAMVNGGKLMLFSAETMLRGDDLETYRQLRTQLLVNLSPKDSWVVAHSLTFRLLLFTRERRLREAIRNALRTHQVSTFLAAHGLATTYPAIIAE